jgi:hypothetical protein
MKLDWKGRVTNMATAAPRAIDNSASSNFEKTCEQVGNAVDTGSVGAIYAKLQKMIMQYYEDVQCQAKASFNIAKWLAIAGFGVLVGTLLFVVYTNWPDHNSANSVASAWKGVGGVGVVSGAALEFISGTAFFLYTRSARQFGAFHICLERTHRYLLAYKIAEQIQDRKYDAYRALVCIMANAPMISTRDIEAPNSGQELADIEKLISSLEGSGQTRAQAPAATIR